MKLFSLLFTLVLAGDTLSVPVEGEERQLLNFADCLKLKAAKIAGAGILPFKGAALGIVAEALCNEEFKLPEIPDGKDKGKKGKERDRLVGTLWDIFSKLSEKPDSPKLPELPEIPKIPGLPELPKIPGLPDVPKLPGIPELPKIPGLPDIPEIPDFGKGKGKGKDGKGKGKDGKGKEGKGKGDHGKGKGKGK